MCLFSGPHKGAFTTMYIQYTYTLYIQQSIIYLYKHMYVYAPSSESRCNHCVHGPATGLFPCTVNAYSLTKHRTAPVPITSHTTDP